MDFPDIANFLTLVIIGLLSFLTFVLLLFVYIAPTTYDPYQRSDRKLSVQVLVLGDIGRSPRMQYHAISLLKEGAEVQLIGFCDSTLHSDLQNATGLSVLPLTPAPEVLQSASYLPFVLTGPAKAIWQAIDLYHALAYRTRASKWMLVQNPPAIPTLLVAQSVCYLRSTKLVIDWHNFGWSVLATKLGQHHYFVRIARKYEDLVSSLADAHLSVTQAMADTLARVLGKRPIVLHDRPANIFQPLSSSQRQNFLRSCEYTKAFAQDLAGGRTRLVVSSTSWTADEDFSILLDALVSYSEKASNGTRLPCILVVITGKGPLREYYLKRIAGLNQAKKLSKVVLVTAWLSFEDYAKLLGAADLGVCLHQSTSGLDLPMKVLDMFGAGLPVIGWSGYSTWSELIREDVNGKGFLEADQLAHLLQSLLGSNPQALGQLRSGALEEGKLRWDQEWQTAAGQLFVPGRYQ